MRRLLPLAFLLAPIAAPAHVVLDTATAPANAYVRVAFRVGHGCDGAATTRIAVTLPSALPLARPQPKPGWRILPRAAATDPIVWEGGPLADQHFDEFVMLIHTPDRPGSLAFPVVQGCAEGRTSRWDGADTPRLEVTAPEPTARRH